MIPYLLGTMMTRKRTNSKEVSQRKPPDTPFHQQRMPSWEPRMTPFRIVGLFLAIGVIFVSSGVALNNTSDSIYESTIVYDDTRTSCSIQSPNEGKTCQVSFTVTKDISKSLYLYYQVRNLYQNHRYYVSSLSVLQLQGQNLGKSDISTTCAGLYRNGSKILNPCGLVANSFFTDIFKLENSKLELNEDGISLVGDDRKFKQVQGFKAAKVSAENSTCPFSSCTGTYFDKKTQSFYKYHYPDSESVQYLYQTYPNNISPLEGITNEHFMVWMAPSAFSDFRKLYGKIEGEVKKGDVLTFKITSNYEIASFDGKKALVLTEDGPLGFKNPNLGISYIVLGVFSFIFAFIFALKLFLFPRQIGAK